MQLNNVIARIEVGFFPEKNKIEKLKKISLKKKYFINKKKINKFNFKNSPTNLNIALCNLSKYVGTVFPGENSIIAEINISKVDYKYGNNVMIYSDSSLVKKGFPTIYNMLRYENYNIQFRTLIRPKLKIKLKKPKSKILKQVKLIKNNILIIGASSGIGNDLLQLFSNNKKIKVIGTYYKNKILKKNKNFIIKKVNIEKNLSLIYSIIKRYKPITIYYFPTPKILFKSIKDKNFINLYKKYFIEIPMKIIRFSNKYECRFFYPSTTYNNSLSPYSLIKLKAEKEIKKCDEEIEKQNNKMKYTSPKDYRDVPRTPLEIMKVIEEQNPRELRKELNDVAQNIRELIQEDK